MKAIVCDSPGGPEVLKLADISEPVVPDDGVLVRVHAASVNPVDEFPMTSVGQFMTKLRRSSTRHVLGVDFAGTVASVGKTVTRFKPGDEVFGGQRGALAEYVCLPETGAVVHKPANVTFEQAASVAVAGSTALQAVRDHGRMQPGQQVLVNGASGGVGTFTVQIARALGGEVTGVCSPRNVDIVRSLGAHHVLDYTKTDFTHGAQRYDVLIDIAGSKSWSECVRVLADHAAFVQTGAASVQRQSSWRALGHFVKTWLGSLRSGRRFVFFIAKLNQADLMTLGALLESGQVRPVIDRCYELKETPEAMRYLGQGHAQGKIVVKVTGPESTPVAPGV
jgi:NADPH:quinone reductase-like Zn-dependent oxidoreductase